MVWGIPAVPGTAELAEVPGVEEVDQAEPIERPGSAGQPAGVEGSAGASTGRGATPRVTPL